MADGQATAREHESSVTLRYSYRDPCPHQCPASRRQIHPLDRTQIVAASPMWARSGIRPGTRRRKGTCRGRSELIRRIGIGRFQATGFRS